MFRILATLAAIPAVLGVLVGCSENNLRPIDKAEAEPVADIEVTPTLLKFSELASTETETQTFQVKNVGDAPLQVTDVVIETGGDSFTLIGEEAEFLLDPDESETFDVVFQPVESMEVFGQVVVFSDDGDEPEVPVDLEGLGATPQLVITPDPYDFGQQYIPCTEEVEITLENVGKEPLVIDDLDYVTKDLQLELIDLNKYPITLNQGETADVLVSYTPEQVAQASGELTVISNDPRGPLSAEQSGEGLYVTNVTDDFIVPTNPPVDIMFMVDQSCSMDSVTVPLGQAFTDFINQINNVTQGWNIGVATNDDGCFNSGVLTSSTPSYQTTFASAVSTGGCTGGYPTCQTESLLGLAYTALNKTAPGQCNDGFLRSGAMLHIIFVSDEMDQTHNSYSQYSTPAQMGTAAVGFYQSFVSSNSLLKVSTIADIYTACGDGTGADGYYEAATATGGELLDVCTSAWSSKTQDLALASLSGINEYQLSQSPDPNSIDVYVDNQLLGPTEWHYDPSTNSVVFDITLDGGDEIEIGYGVVGSCSP